MEIPEYDLAEIKAIEDDLDKTQEISDDSDDELANYTGLRSKRRLLTSEQEFDLTTRARQGDEKARTIIIEANIRLAIYVARKMHNKYLSFDLSDLVQEGIIGICRAVESFDPNKGFRFSTYATWWIRRCIQRAIFNKDREIRLPVYVCELLRKYQRIESWMMLTRGSASLEQVAEEMGMDPRQLKKVVDVGRSIVSLSTPIGSDNETRELLDVLSDPKSEIKSSVDIEKLISALPVRERIAAEMRFLEGRTHDEIAEELCLSRTMTNQILIRARQRIQSMLLADSQ